MKKLIFVLSITFLMLQSCSSGDNKDSNTVAQVSTPQLSTSIITDISQTTATSGSNITSNGNAQITAKGIVWSTSPNPTINTGSKTTDANAALGAFTSLMTGLSSNTVYYVRAYSTNLKGTSYGDEKTFQTAATPLPSLYLSTTGFHSITTDSAIGCVTTIYNYTGVAITSCGVVWSTSPNPTVALSTKTSQGFQQYNFSSDLTSLNVTTTYYYRAYAITSLGTFYGNESSVKTIAVYSYSQGPSVKDIDGNSYPTIITNCNNQTWTTKNLNVSRYRNGDIIPQVTNDISAWNSKTTGAWCYHSENSANGIIYGKLYNWYAVNDPRGLAPEGFHVATGGEWGDFIRCLGQGILAGGKMKAIGTTQWLAPNTDATNSSGFNGIPGGRKTQAGFAGRLGEVGEWWDYNSGSHKLSSSDGWIISYNNPTKLFNGYSVRCVKN